MGYHLALTAVIAAVLCLRALFRKHVSPRWIHALWLAVLLRMLLPVSFPVELAVLPPAEQPPQISGETVEKPRPEPPQLSGVRPTAPAVTAAPSVTQAQEEAKLGWEKIRWLGTAVLALWFTVSGGLFWLSLRKERILDGKVGVLKVYRTPQVASPCLAGLVPAVYLGRTYLPEEEREMILRHEYCHFLRGDPLWALARTVAVSLFWYNPAVWLAATYSKIDGELACDDAVCARMDGTQRLQYANCLINASQTPQRFALPWGGSPMKERIRMVTKVRKKNVGFVILALMLALCTVGCSLMELKAVPAAAAQIQEKTEEKAPASSQKEEPPASSTKEQTVPPSSSQAEVPPVSTVGPVEGSELNGSFYCRRDGLRLHLSFDRSNKQLRIEQAEGNGELMPCLSGSYEESKEGEEIAVHAVLSAKGKEAGVLEFSLKDLWKGQEYEYTFLSFQGEEELFPFVLKKDPKERFLSFVREDRLYSSLYQKDTQGVRTLTFGQFGCNLSLWVPEEWQWEWDSGMFLEDAPVQEPTGAKRVEFFLNQTMEDVKEGERERGEEDLLWDQAVTGTSASGVSYVVVPETKQGFSPYGEVGRRIFVFLSFEEYDLFFTVYEFDDLDKNTSFMEKTVMAIAQSLAVRPL